LATLNNVKRRTKSQEPDPEPFLDAVAAGPDEPGSSGVAEQRALVAEGSLRQMRAEAEQRLADARTALQQERALRHEAEEEVRRLREHLHHASGDDASGPAVFAPSGALAASTDSVPLPERVRGPGSNHGAWPSPWLAEGS
jgi:hypothetical protein